MKKKLYLAVILLVGVAGYAPAFEAKFSGRAEVTGGYGNDLDFDKNTKEDRWYFNQIFIPRLDLTFNDRLSYVGEFQLVHREGDKGAPGSSMEINSADFKLRKFYLNWLTRHDSIVKIGYQYLTLPSFTFGNPLYNSYASAITSSGEINDKLSMELFVSFPLKTDDNLPEGDDSMMIGAILDARYDSFRIKPYLTYFKMRHSGDAVYNWARAPDNGNSYVTAGGLAAEVYLGNSTALKVDMVYGDGNNDKEHDYESKGSLGAVLLEREGARATPGLFAWYSSGNDWKLQQHEDYGFLPAVGMEGGFAPTRLGFKGGGPAGRDGLLSSNGVGTAGVGAHIKNISFVENISHVLRAAYIKGTSRGQGAGAPPYVTVPSLVKPEGDPGVMTNKDYAVEFNFDTVYNASKWLDIILETGYIISGFSNEKYNKDIFNIQLTLRALF